MSSGPPTGSPAQSSRRLPPGRTVAKFNTCPLCSGQKTRDAGRCRTCFELEAATYRLCPRCGYRKNRSSRVCAACYYATGMSVAPIHIARDDSGCAHHWALETPTGGPTSRGRCKRCGAEKDFPNWHDYTKFQLSWSGGSPPIVHREDAERPIEGHETIYY